MAKTLLIGGTVHPKVPDDFTKALLAHPKALALWEKITPLARNEWICLVEEAKQPETRARRIKRAYDQLSRGQRRPCCWLGCPHRTDKPLNASQKWILERQAKTKKTA